jgi:Domain of unknown function (DUF4845)
MTGIASWQVGEENNMRSRQSGITFIGWLILLIPIAIVGYAGIRIAPKYMQYYKISKAMEQTATEFAGDEQPNINAMRSALQSRFDIEDIDYPAVADIPIVRDGDHWVMRLAYEETVPLFGQLWLLMKFDKTTVIR